MILDEVKEEIVGKLDQVDLTVLRAINALLDVHTENKTSDVEKSLVETLSGNNPIVGYEVDGTSVKLDQFEEEAEKSAAEIRNGKGIAADEVHEKVEKWLTNSK